jgi:hypothetical protein
MKPELTKFPPVPPRAEWDFSACPEDERLTCLIYSYYRIAQSKDPSFADRLPPEWKSKYPMWPGKPYLGIPKDIRQGAQPELDPGKLRQIMADTVIARTIPDETFEALRLQNILGAPIIHRDGDKTFMLLEVSHGMSPSNLNGHFKALAMEYFGPEGLSARPEGAGSYARQFEADLNALTAYILLETLTPEQATAVTSDLVLSAGKAKNRKHRVKRGLYSTTQKWRAAQKRGELLIKKTLEGQLTAVLLSESLAKAWNGLPATKK